MHPVLTDLLTLLKLERIEENIFRGESRDIGSSRVFGGQVLGQALTAASYTVDDREVHSLHAYFLRAGDVKAPIVYEVDRARDGKSFSNRRVVAIQYGRPIFNMAASFQSPEQGLEHQAEIPDVPPPESLTDLRELPEDLLKGLSQPMRRFLTHERPFEMRPVDPVLLLTPEPSAPRREVWIRTRDRITDEPELHRNLLAYISDYQLLGTSILPHGVRFGDPQMQVASLDHAVWFHRPFRVDDWLLYSMDSPSASGARGLALGRFYARDGTLVASIAQEGLIRLWPVSD